MKCQTCTNKQTTWGLGFCKKCGGNTPSSSYRYCDNCSQQLQQCQVCGTGMGTSTASPAPSGPTPFTTKVTTKDNGTTVRGVRTGEHVEITLDEDQHSGKQWAVLSKDWQFSTYSSGQFTQNPRNPQYGTRSFVFSCDTAGLGDIELHEVTRSYGYGWGGSSGGSTPAPGGQTFKVSIEVG